MYVILWQFVVREGSEGAFQRAYGADGEWARFFRTGAGFVGVELLCDPRDPRKFVTIDRWETATAYEEFSRLNAIKYREIDDRCERLTAMETHVGSFVAVGESVKADERSSHDRRDISSP